MRTTCRICKKGEMISNGDEWILSATYNCSHCGTFKCDIGFWYEKKESGRFKKVTFGDDPKDWVGLKF